MPGEYNGIRDAELAGEPFERLPLGSVSANDEAGPGGRLPHVRHGVKEDVEPLDTCQPPGGQDQGGLARHAVALPETAACFVRDTAELLQRHAAGHGHVTIGRADSPVQRLHGLQVGKRHQACRVSRQPPLETDKKACGQSAEIPVKDVAMRSVDGGYATQACRQPADGAGLGAVRVHEVILRFAQDPQ